MKLHELKAQVDQAILAQESLLSTARQAKENSPNGVTADERIILENLAHIFRVKIRGITSLAAVVSVDAKIAHRDLANRNVTLDETFLEGFVDEANWS